MPVIRAAEATEFVVGETTFTALARPATGARRTSAWRVRVAPGTAGATHRLTDEELFVALAGEATVTFDGVAHQVRAGDAIVLPADVEFSLANPGPAAFEAVAVLPVGTEVITGDGSRFVPPWAA